MATRPKKYTFPEALKRLRRYCAYQERCHQEVRQKLYDWGFGSEDMDKVSVQLMEEGFLNEERFVKAIAGGKFRQKGWGRKKIEATLKSKGISDYLVRNSMKGIDEADYIGKLDELLRKKAAALKAENPLILRQKLARYCISKGYESEKVWERVNTMLDEKKEE